MKAKEICSMVADTMEACGGREPLVRVRSALGVLCVESVKGGTVDIRSYGRSDIKPLDAVVDGAHLKGILSLTRGDVSLSKEDDRLLVKGPGCETYIPIASGEPVTATRFGKFGGSGGKAYKTPGLGRMVKEVAYAADASSADTRFRAVALCLSDIGVVTYAVEAQHVAVRKNGNFPIVQEDARTYLADAACLSRVLGIMSDDVTLEVPEGDPRYVNYVKFSDKGHVAAVSLMSDSPVNLAPLIKNFNVSTARFSADSGELLNAVRYMGLTSKDVVIDIRDGTIRLSGKSERGSGSYSVSGSVSGDVGNKVFLFSVQKLVPVLQSFHGERVDFYAVDNTCLYMYGHSHRSYSICIGKRYDPAAADAAAEKAS